MSRFLLLFLFLIWMAWRAKYNGAVPIQSENLVLFFGLYAFMVGILGAWSRLLSQRVGRDRLGRQMRYFNRIAFLARTFVPIWFAIGVFDLNWGDAVQRLLGPLRVWPVQVPGAIIGILPPILAWCGLWWAQYPADRALREQSMLIRFDNDLPIFRPPPFRAYLANHLRLQVLFTAIPILLILFAHDIVMVLLWRGFGMQIQQSPAESLVTFGCALGVFIIVPEILIRVLPTHSLPASALRERMETMSRTHGLRFRDILIWRTDHRLANALVMGVVPRFRYVLLSDLLLQEMTDEQIEAVFAHELGHVVHRHMIWYLVFMAVLILALAAVALLLELSFADFTLPQWLPPDLLMNVLGFGAFIIAFGYVSRRFERQADVFAARTMQRRLIDAPTDVPAAEAAPGSPSNHVGPAGASVFASALERVAVINNMPLGPRGRFEGSLARRLGFVMELIGDVASNWLHGSISHRVRTLHLMSAHPDHTRRFDRRMARLYISLLAALLAGGAFAWLGGAPL